MIYIGDSLQILKLLESESVQCCVTSPPYWGLRDYNTAKWEGGNLECDHIERNIGMSNKNSLCPNKKLPLTNSANIGRKMQYKTICGKCNAYRIDNQIGLEESPDQYVEKLVRVFREVKRILMPNSTLWLNLGDSYAGSGKGRKAVGNLKPKDLVGIPWRVAFALQADGWYLRQDIIWHKINPMPESVTDRCTKAHEYIFLLSQSKDYYFDYKAIREPAVQNRWGGKKAMNVKNSKDCNNVFGGLTRERDMMPEFRNKRDVWTVASKPYRGAHFATFPPDLIRPCILAGSTKQGIVLDPFFGAGTTGLVAIQNDRKFIGIELNPAYVKLAKKRIKKETNHVAEVYELVEE